MEALDNMETGLQIFFLTLLLVSIVMSWYVYKIMSKERKIDKEYNMYMVLWSNPRSIERIKILDGPMTDKDKLYRVELINGQIMFRYPHQVFDTIKKVSIHLETEDYRSIH